MSVAAAHWKALLTACTFVICLSISRRSRELFFSLVGHETNLTQEHVGYVVAFSYILDAVLFPVAGWLLDNIGWVRTGALSSGLFSFAFVVLQFGSVFSFILFGLFGGFANGISAGVVQMIGAELAPADCRGQFMGIFRTLSQTSDFMAPLIIGVVADSRSLFVAEGTISGVGIFGVCWALCVVQRQRQRASAEAKSVPSKVANPAKIEKSTKLGKSTKYAAVIKTDSTPGAADKQRAYVEFEDDSEANATAEPQAVVGEDNDSNITAEVDAKMSFAT